MYVAHVWWFLFGAITLASTNWYLPIGIYQLVSKDLLTLLSKIIRHSDIELLAVIKLNKVTVSRTNPCFVIDSSFHVLYDWEMNWGDNTIAQTTNAQLIFTLLSWKLVTQLCNNYHSKLSLWLNLQICWRFFTDNDRK